MNRKKILTWSIPLAVVVLLLVFAIGYCSKTTITQGELARRLEAEGSDTIEINGTVKIKKPLVVKGEKTLTGKGSLVLHKALDGEWPDEDGKSNTWGTGCAQLSVEDAENMAAALTVENGAKLVIKGSAKIDANKNANAVHVEDGGSLILGGKGSILNGRYTNLVIAENGTVEIQGGKVLDAQAYGVINSGTFKLSGGTLSGAENGAVLFNTGKATQTDGVIEKAGIHNVYVEAGEFLMTGGRNDAAKKDGIVIAENGTGDVSGGKITNCTHGLCNNGELTSGEVELNECGMMNYKTGNFIIEETIVDTSAVYCLANNGGTVSATGFTAKRCDTCAVYNFSGDMNLVDLKITGSRDGNIANAGGTLNVKNAMLDKCRDKSIVVGNGKAIFQNVTIAGTSREKYGVYVYGGELYVTKATVYDISSTAFKVDTGGYLEAKEIEMKDIKEIGFRADGGKILAKDVSMKELGSHAVYNLEGEITISDATIDDVKKNALQQKGGKTVLNEIQADNIGNHGAYIELGKVTITNSVLKNMTSNGLYMVKGENETVLKNVVLDGAGKQGINNSSKLTIDGLTVKNAAQNGIFNKEKGNITAKNVVISDVREHGVNNYNVMELQDAEISHTGKGSNGLQNKGTLSMEGVVVSDSQNHGVYNIGTVKGSDLTVKTVKKNGIYNNKGTFTVKKVNIDDTGEHGVNNTAKMQISDVTVNHTGAKKNNIQNAGTLKITGATLKNSLNHGIYNKGTLVGTGVNITDPRGNGIYNNGGTLVAKTGAIKGTGQHGICNEKTMTLSDINIDSTGKGKNGIQNTGVIKSAKNITIRNSKNHGVFNDGKMSGTNFLIENVEDLAINNNGDMNLNHLQTKGVAHKAIYNSGSAKFTQSTIDGIQVSNEEAEYLVDNNGGNLSLTNTTLINANGTALHNRGNAKSSVTNVIINTAGNYGVFVENGATLSGNGLEINNITKNAAISDAEGIPIKNAGKIDSLNNVTIGADDSAITGSGAEVATQLGSIVNNAIVNDTETSSFSGNNLVIKNVVDSNAFYNKGTAAITNLTIDCAKDGIVSRNNGWVTLAGNISITNSSRNPLVTYGPNESGDTNVYDNGIRIASESNVLIDGSVGHGINNKGSFLAAADSDITLKNITGQNANAVNNQNTGTMTLGNLTVDGVHVEVTNSNTSSGTALMLNGVTTIDGHVEISNVYYQGNQDNTNGSGVVVKNSGVVTGKGSITINGALADDEWKGTYNGIFVNKRSLKLAGDIVVHNVSNQGIYIADENANLEAGNVTVSNVGANAFYINKTSGSAKIAGTLHAVSPTKGRGVYNSGGTLEAGNIVVQNLNNAYSPIENSGSIMVTGNVTIEGAKDAAGIRNKGTFTVKGMTKITDISGTKDVNGIRNDSGKTMNLNNVMISNIKQTSVVENYGNGMYIQGTLNLSGTANVSDVYPDSTSNKNNANTGVLNTGTIKGTGSIIVDNIGGNGIYSKNGQIDLEKITVTNAGLNSSLHGIYLEGGSDMKADTILVDTTGKQGIQLQHANTLTANEITVQNVKGNGLRLFNNNSNPTVKIEKLVAINCSEYGITAQKPISSGITVSTMMYRNCGKGAIHGNIKKGVATPQQIAQ